MSSHVLAVALEFNKTGILRLALEHLTFQTVFENILWPKKKSFALVVYFLPISEVSDIHRLSLAHLVVDERGPIFGKSRRLESCGTNRFSDIRVETLCKIPK